MSATSRLFSIIQTLRVAKKPVTAQELAKDLEVSLRTIYRDIVELQTQNIPIIGEAGIGYVLQQGYDMPPLMLNTDELEAALLGAKWVADRGDAALAKGARSLIEKLEITAPLHLREIIPLSTVTVPSLTAIVPDIIDSQQLRTAVREGRKITIEYCKPSGKISHRTVWPFMMAYFESVRLIVCWCEKRNDFRHFRTDRIKHIQVLDESFPITTGELKEKWWRQENHKISNIKN